MKNNIPERLSKVIRHRGTHRTLLQGALLCASACSWWVKVQHSIFASFGAKQKERLIICLQDDAKPDFFIGYLACLYLLLVHYEVERLINYRGDSEVVTVRSTSAWPPQFLNTCWALRSSFNRAVNMPFFTETADVILGGRKWHFSDWKVVFWCIFSTFFGSMSRER